MLIKERTTCRISNEPLFQIFDLGDLPISSFPQPLEKDPELHPVVLMCCNKSGLVQLKHTIDPNEMYSQYWYMSGINLSMRKALGSIVENALQRSKDYLVKGDVVVDIASNDGTLLSCYPSDFYRVGIDPAKNILPKVCDLHINDFFSASAYKKHLLDTKAKIVTSIAMFYDLEDPIQFASDVKSILDTDGLWIIELSYMPTMLQLNSFDTICAEHLEYYSLNSIEYILQKVGLEVEDVELNSVNGGSFRLYIRHCGKAVETQAVKDMRRNEAALDLLNPQVYQDFADRVKRNRDQMLTFLRMQIKLGKTVIGYGASTKGNTILSYYGIGPELLPYVAERNPIKWGRQTVTRIPIISEEEARSKKPDYFLAFPYHFMDEFLIREADFLNRGGKFVSPIPCLTIYGASGFKVEVFENDLCAVVD